MLLIKGEQGIIFRLTTLLKSVLIVYINLLMQGK